MRDHVIKQGHLFWRDNSKGYTDRIAFAGLYTAEHAHRIARGGRNPPDIAIPLLRFEDDIRRALKDTREELTCLTDLMEHIENIKIDRANHPLPLGGDTVD